jgi:hypothetical protein
MACLLPVGLDIQIQPLVDDVYWFPGVKIVLSILEYVKLASAQDIMVPLAL